MNQPRKPRTVFEHSREPAELSTIDMLEAMFRNPMTRGLISNPKVRVVQEVDPTTGRVTYSFRSPDDPSYDEDTTPSV
jgi:hypothetical protein